MAEGAGTEVRVLLVEDQEAVRRLSEELLLDAGYGVTAVADAVAALALVEADPGRFDLLLTDVTMPGLGGAELARRVRALRPGLPVVYTSGYGGDALAGEAGEFLQKPFTRADLVAALERALL